MGLGPIILGYCHPAVDVAICRQLDDGITFSLMHPLEVDLAELFRECIPCSRSNANGSKMTQAVWSSMAAAAAALSLYFIV